MATIAAASPHARVERTRFYLWLTGAMVLVAFAGFTPTFWSPMARGASVGAPVLIVHGLLFSAWVVFLFTQAALVASGRTLRHKDWGLAGVALASAMAFSVPLVVLTQLADAEAAGYGDQARRFAIVPLLALPLWGGLLILAFANVRRPEVHKRLILVATISMLQAAVARFFLLAVGGPPGGPPPSVVFTVPAALVTDRLLVAAMTYDWRTRGRPHPVYIAGGALVLAKQLLIVPMSLTPQWIAAVQQFERLRG